MTPYTLTQDEIDYVESLGLYLARFDYTPPEQALKAGDSLLGGTVHWIIADDDTTITSAKFAYINNRGTRRTQDYSIVTGGKKASTTPPTFESTFSDFEIVVSSSVIYRITQADLDDCLTKGYVIHINGELVELGTKLNLNDEIRIYTNEGYTFDGSQYLARISSTGSPSNRIFSVVSETEQVISKATTVVGGSVVGFLVETIAPDPDPDLDPDPDPDPDPEPEHWHTLTAEDIAVFTNSSVKLYVNGALAVVGGGLEYGDVLKVVVGMGRVFRPNSVGLKYLLGGEYVTGQKFFTLNDEENEGELTLYFDGYSVQFDSFFSNTYQPRPETVKGYNNIYSLTDSELELVTVARFEGGTQQDPIDYGKYFIGLISLPFELDPELILENENIILGDSTFGATGTLLATDTIVLDLGTIEVVGEFQDFRDYKSVDTFLHLPYVDKIQVPVEYVINQVIGVKYVVSLYDGTAIVRISSDKLGGKTVITETADLNLHIPFSVGEFVPDKSKPNNIRLGGDNGIYQAFIEVVQNEFLNVEDSLNATVSDFGVLGEHKGFITVENIDFSGVINDEETQMIMNILNSGVMIK